MRVSKLVMDSFRGFRSFELRCLGHVVLSGVPRAGRSDVITALARVLLPDSARTSPAMSDLWQTTASAAGTGTDEIGMEAAIDAGEQGSSEQCSSVGFQCRPFADVEVTLTDLDPDLQQLFDGLLEPCGPDGCAVAEDEARPGAGWCVRLAYRLVYDSGTEALEQFVYYPLASNPAAGKYTRVPAATRRALPVVPLDVGRPLQLRAGSPLRRVMDELDPAAAAGAFDALRANVSDAAESLANHGAVSQAVEIALSSGGVLACLSEGSADAVVGFRADDGSAEGLLRSLQATLHLDDAGPLALSSHGSTASAMLGVAEAIRLAVAPGAIVLADDFGDQLDTANAEHLAARLRASAGQLWLSTRRPEVARAFDPEELVRLTRHGGRKSHRVPRLADKRGIRARRQFHTQLLPAMTSPTVAITEGPHDLVVYGTVDRQRLPGAAPLSAAGVRLVAAGTGQDGGIGEIPVVACLARSLGFRVIALIDRDKAEDQTIKQIEDSCDVVVRLPPRTAIEGALLAGADLAAIRTASATLTVFISQDPAHGVSDSDLVGVMKHSLHKKSLHEPFLDALVEETDQPPPMIVNVLDQVIAAASPSYSGPTIIDIPAITPPSPAGSA